MKNSDCPFCTLPTRRITHSNDIGIIVRDGYPVSPGHSLIIPKAHYPDFFALPANERLGLLELLSTAKQQLDDEFQPDGYNIGINNGESAGQTVLHLHIHLIPRYAGDQTDPRGGVRWIFSEKADYWS